ncbi:FBP domain-containing protein [Kribbella antibiotica]|uniref:FBP domain-containing protein n=1 Tax=Kribbella antibiotica TaxID=190195 RepID=A0A4V2YQC5_9ACTN|nr:FBP domain-containing protein [Kribbella antibiotica]TDD61467.1 FBP domain-containing protein [Kribbella antibiotica]
MKPITESEIRRSFVNCSQGEAKRLAVPKDLETLPWEHLDFLGWRDAGAPDRGYIVAEREDGTLTGITLKAAKGAARGFTSRSMCSLCKTTRTGGGVALMAARRSGVAGRQGNTVGEYLCTDLACSLYVRGKKQVASEPGLEETLSVEAKIARLEANLTTFVAKVTK